MEHNDYTTDSDLVQFDEMQCANLRVYVCGDSYCDDSCGLYAGNFDQNNNCNAMSACGII